MNLTLPVEQSDMDAFTRILDAACRAGAFIAPDVTTWLGLMQTAIAEAQKPQIDLKEDPNG